MPLMYYNKELPDWLYRNLNKRCPYCKADIRDFGPLGKDGKMKYTQRYCLNPSCPGHLSHRVVTLAKRFNMPGIGPETALSYVNLYKLDNHLEVLPYWFKEKPKVHLWEVGDLSMIYGMSNSWKEITRGVSSFEEYFKKTFIVPDLIAQNKEYLLYAESFFDVQEALSTKVINVMMSGSFTGYSKRADLINNINKYYGKHVQVVDVGKRGKDVHYLVKEAYATDHAKTDLAKNNDIPIITPDELLLKIRDIVTYNIENNII